MVKKMNSDVSKELLRKINKSFTLSYQKSEKVRKLLLAIKSKNCDYLKAMEYAEEVGKILAEAYMKNLSSDVLPDGKMYYDIASAILNPTLENNYGLISSYVCGAMDVMNEKAGINAKARKPSYNADKTLGLIKKVSEAEYFDDVKKYLNEPVITNALSIVDEGARVNADLHYSMGYNPVIVRRASFGCCKWCRGLAGVYNYDEVKDKGNDVFRRHANCRCQVIYDPRNGDGKVQDVHSKEIIELNTSSKVREDILSAEEVIEKAKKYANDFINGIDKIDYTTDNPYFDYIVKKLNYNGLPQLKSAKEFEKSSSQSKVGKMYRAISGETKEDSLKYVNELKHGKMYAGKHYVYGSGIYFSRDPNVVAKYNNQGVIIEATLAEESRIVYYNDVLREYCEIGADKIKNSKSKEPWQFLISTIGEFAALKGYDAIDMNGMFGQKHIIVLNRGMLIINEN
jgi:hypothetical protein